MQQNATISQEGKDTFFPLFLQISMLTGASVLHCQLHLYTFHLFRYNSLKSSNNSSAHHPIYHIHQQVSTSLYFQRNKMFSMLTLFFTLLTHTKFFTRCNLCHTLTWGFTWSCLKLTTTVTVIVWLVCF